MPRQAITTCSTTRRPDRDKADREGPPYERFVIVVPFVADSLRARRGWIASKIPLAAFFLTLSHAKCWPFMAM